MLIWLIAAVAGLAAALLAYGSRPVGLGIAAASLRAISAAGCVALLLDAAVGVRRKAPPIVAMDVSESWLRGRDSSAFRTAFERARSEASDSLLVFGDSVRSGKKNLPAADRASHLRPVTEHALASGRPLVVYTDGELDDADALASLPSGSVIHVAPAGSARDIAISDLRAPRALVSGDTLELTVTLGAGATGGGRSRLSVTLGDRPAPAVDVDSLGAFAERTVRVRMLVPSGAGPALLRVVVQSPDDREPRNDTLSTAVDLAPTAGAVLVSTNPDLDVREISAILRGTVSLPTRGFYRVAPGIWREEGSLASVPEDVVRKAAREAPMLVLHGDTTVFGDPRINSRGSLMLFAPPRESTGEWYATGAPPSPVAAALSGSQWDSLPPLDVSAVLPTGESEVLETRRARRLERRVAIVAWEHPRRVVVVGASGFWRWRFRGGAGVGVQTALWGSLLDWLAAERTDVRAAVPVDGAVRAGSPVRWRRGTPADSVATVVLVRRGSGSTDTLALRFAPGVSTTESPPRAPGVYDVRAKGGNSILVVNPSAEMLPRRATVRDGSVGAGAVFGEAPHLRNYGWIFALIIVALCGEWLLRRRVGLR